MTTDQILTLVFEELPDNEPAPDFSKLIAEKAARLRASDTTVNNVRAAAMVKATAGERISLRGNIS